MPVHDGRRVSTGGRLDASSLAIEQSRNIMLTINAAAAKALGLRVPQSILARADRLID